MVAGAAPDFEVTALLCDSAQVQNGKLFILGAGWDRIMNPGVPIMTALALIITVPWTRANERHALRAALFTDDGREFVPQPGGPPLRAEGQFEVGRPPGTPQGAGLLVPMGINVPPVAYAPGGYRWEIGIDGKVLKTIPFYVGQP